MIDWKIYGSNSHIRECILESGNSGISLKIEETESGSFLAKFYHRFYEAAEKMDEKRFEKLEQAESYLEGKVFEYFQNVINMRNIFVTFKYNVKK